VQRKLPGISIAFAGRTGRLAPIPLQVDRLLTLLVVISEIVLTHASIERSRQKNERQKDGTCGGLAYEAMDRAFAIQRP
jgi:hypothetical protein